VWGDPLSENPSMHVLTTGSDGFIGRHLGNYLAERGDTVVGLEGARVDVRDLATMREAVREARPDAIVHLAAQSHVGRSFESPIETFDVNVLGTAAVLEAVRHEAPSARVVVASSAEVYGAAAGGDLPLDETTDLRPVSPYAASKVAQEVVAMQYQRAFEIDVVVIRLFNTIGPGQSTAFALPAFASQLAAIADGAEPVLRVGNLAAERDFTDVRDVVRAYALALSANTPSGIYNVCSERTISIRDALALMIETSGLDVHVEVDSARFRPVDVPRIVGSAERLRRATGWEPTIALRQSLADLYAHERARGR